MSRSGTEPASGSAVVALMDDEATNLLAPYLDFSDSAQVPATLLLTSLIAQMQSLADIYDQGPNEDQNVTLVKRSLTHGQSPNQFSSEYGISATEMVLLDPYMPIQAMEVMLAYGGAPYKRLPDGTLYSVLDVAKTFLGTYESPLLLSKYELVVTTFTKPSLGLGPLALQNTRPATGPDEKSTGSPTTVGPTAAARASAPSPGTAGVKVTDITYSQATAGVLTTVTFDRHARLYTVLKPLKAMTAVEKDCLKVLFCKHFIDPNDKPTAAEGSTEPKDKPNRSAETFDGDFNPHGERAAHKLVEIISTDPKGEHIVGFNLFEIDRPNPAQKPKAGGDDAKLDDTTDEQTRRLVAAIQQLPPLPREPKNTQTPKQPLVLHVVYVALEPEYRGTGIVPYLFFRPAIALQTLNPTETVGIFYNAIHPKSYEFVTKNIHFPKYQSPRTRQIARDCIGSFYGSLDGLIYNPALEAHYIKEDPTLSVAIFDEKAEASIQRTLPSRIFNTLILASQQHAGAPVYCDLNSQFYNELVRCYGKKGITQATLEAFPEKVQALIPHDVDYRKYSNPLRGLPDAISHFYRGSLMAPPPKTASDAKPEEGAAPDEANRGKSVKVRGQ